MLEVIKSILFYIWYWLMLIIELIISFVQGR